MIPDRAGCGILQQLVYCVYPRWQNSQKGGGSMYKMRKIGKWMIPAATALLPFVVFAIAPPVITDQGGAVTLLQIEGLIKAIANFLVIVSVIVAVIFIIYGGIRWVMARDNDDAVKSAKAIVKNGIFGALVILGVGVILQTLAGVVARTFYGGYQ